ncbi:MAG TPA: hypothetical protein VMW89_11170 [Desulfatiglandales bacterium]|nr:hypothetical protein [Desulfatiglandales bacterium]
MRFLLAVISVSAIFLCSVSLAQSPPFSRVTIAGETDTKFKKVSLFESGGSRKPFKTEHISEYDGQYSIDVDIPYDMRKKDSYLFTDMRFWGDKNDNGIKDPGEPISECHFIIWVPSAQIVYMQVYKGSKYPVESSILNYHYKK